MLAVVLFPAAGLAYQLNPLKDRHRGGDAPAFGRSLDSVHEDITHAAVACVEALGDRNLAERVPICSIATRHRNRDEPGNRGNPLIVGLWWNDDPRQFGYANQVLGAALQWSDAQYNARRVRQSGALYTDPRMARLTYRSHFGDLQFLHAMAIRDHESPRVTQQRILGWLGFTYRVASGEIAPQTSLSRTGDPTRYAFSNYPSWTVERLFKPRRNMKPLPIRELALGSFLHTVQDSYAEGHTRRVMTASANCPDGRVMKFLSFLHQETKRHRAADSRAALHLSSGAYLTPMQNPVEASARLLVMARSGADWSTVVEPYLRGTILCVDDDAELSGPGRFK